MCLIKGPLDDAQTGLSGLPLPGGMKVEFPPTLPDVNPGRFCAPRKEGFVRSAALTLGAHSAAYDVATWLE